VLVVNQSYHRQYTRIDNILSHLTKAESKLAAAKVDAEDQEFQFNAERLKYEKQLAIISAKHEELTKREQTLHGRLESKSSECHKAMQEAAVSKKEVDLLRERLKSLDKVKSI